MSDPKIAPLSSGVAQHVDGTSRTTEKSNDVVIWQPARILSNESLNGGDFALLVLNQPLENLDLLKLVWEKAFFRIAADGGANRLFEAFNDMYFTKTINETKLDVVCGDLDSITPAVTDWALANGAKIINDPDQYSTDFKKCVNYVREHFQAPDMVCMGGLGGRVDQGMSTLHHLLLFQGDYMEGKFYLLSSEAMTFVLRPGRHRIQVRDSKTLVFGKHIGILPVGEPSVITTTGLEWDVEEWFTAMGGENLSTSNHVKDDFVTISTTKTVLFTIDLEFPPSNQKQ